MSVPRAEKTYGLFAHPANKKFVAEAEKVGGEIITFPAVETGAIEIDSAAESLLTNLSAFDWIVLTNVFAADYFLRALEKLAIDFFELDALRICAFGETVADRLRFAQVHSDVISNSVKAADAFQALKSYEPDLKAASFLIPKEDKSNPGIAAFLSGAGAGVAALSLYRARVAESPNLPKLKALVKGGAIDEFVFSSPDDVAKMAILFHGENLPDLLDGTIASAFDSATLQSLEEFGITRIVRR